MLRGLLFHATPQYFQVIPFLSSAPLVCNPTYPAREEPAVLEFAKEEGDEESASHQYQR